MLFCHSGRDFCFASSGFWLVTALFHFFTWFLWFWHFVLLLELDIYNIYACDSGIVVHSKKKILCTLHCTDTRIQTCLINENNLYFFFFAHSLYGVKYTQDNFFPYILYRNILERQANISIEYICFATPSPISIVNFKS